MLTSVLTSTNKRRYYTSATCVCIDLYLVSHDKSMLRIAWVSKV